MNANQIGQDQGAALTRIVTGLSVVVAFTLVVLKALVWWTSGSVALLASMADSGLDLSRRG